MTEIAVIGRGRDADDLATRLGDRATIDGEAESADLRASTIIIATEPDADPAPLAAAAGPTAVIAIAVERASITTLAAAHDAPDRLVGFHWVRRGARAGAIELVRPERSEPEALARVGTLLGELGLPSIEVKDRPGLLLDALHLPFLNQAVHALDDGLASAKDLDLAVVLGLGHDVGALQAVEAWGLDDYRERARDLYEQTQNHWHAPPPILERTVDATPEGDRPSLNQGD